MNEIERPAALTNTGISRSGDEPTGRSASAGSHAGWMRRRDQLLTTVAFAVVLALVLSSGTERWRQTGDQNRAVPQETAMLAKAPGKP